METDKLSGRRSETADRSQAPLRLRRDLRARGRDDPPRSAEMHDDLALDVAGLLVRVEVVRGVPAVGDLLLAVLALRGAELRRAQAGANGRLGADQGRPDGCALPVAG